MFWEDTDSEDEDGQLAVEMGLVDEAKDCTTISEAIQMAFNDGLAKDLQSVESLQGVRQHPDERQAVAAAQSRQQYVKLISVVTMTVTNLGQNASRNCVSVTSNVAYLQEWGSPPTGSLGR